MHKLLAEGSTNPAHPPAPAPAAPTTHARPCRDAIKRNGYLKRHQQKKQVQAAKEAKEAELLRTWPHGLPVSGCTCCVGFRSCCC